MDAVDEGCVAAEVGWGVGLVAMCRGGRDGRGWREAVVMKVE
jgi:hypothetical protein